MVYRPNVDEQLCFVLLPLRSPFLGHFEQIIKPAALEAALTAVKADDIYGTRSVIKDIWDEIWKARVIVAIVTDKNPNVNYELGICHSLGIPTVLVTEHEDDVPFDYRHRRYIKYVTRDAGWETKLREELAKTLNAVLSSPPVEDELSWPYDTFGILPRAKPRLVSSSQGTQRVFRGVASVSAAVATAFGPRGAQVSVVGRYGNVVAYRRGLRIVDAVKSDDPLAMQGVEQMRRLASDVFEAAGDYTKSAMLITESMLRFGLRAVENGYPRADIVVGMQVAVDTAITHLKIRFVRRNHG